MARCIGMFGGKVLGALEDTYSVIFGEKCVGDLGESFWTKTRSAILEIWRKLLGEIVVGDFWRKPFGDVVLELVMEYRSARRPYVEIKK